MYLKLVEHLISLKEKDIFMESVYSKAHSNALFIWWYSVKLDELECFPCSEVDLHTCEKFTLPRRNDVGELIKGRVYDDEGKPKLMIYCDYSKPLINQVVLQRIVLKLQSATNLDFYAIDDNEGKEIILEKKI